MSIQKVKNTIDPSVVVGNCDQGVAMGNTSVSLMCNGYNNTFSSGSTITAYGMYSVETRKTGRTV